MTNTVMDTCRMMWEHLIQASKLRPGEVIDQESVPGSWDSISKYIEMRQTLENWEANSL